MALKDKLMTLEDFKAVRDVDVASNSAQFTEINESLGDVRADLGAMSTSTVISDYSIESGSIHTDTGADMNNLTNRCRTGFISFNGEKMTVTPKSGYKVTSRIYADATIGSYEGHGDFTEGTIELTDSTKYYRFVIGAVDDSTISPSSLPEDVISILDISYTDATLSESGKSADAAETGARIQSLRNDLSNVEGDLPNLFWVSNTISRTEYGVTRTYHKDGTVTFNGTATQTFNIGIMGAPNRLGNNIEAGTYIFDRQYKGDGSAPTRNPYFHTDEGSILLGIPKTFDGATNVHITIGKEYVFNNDTYSFSIRKEGKTAVDETARQITPKKTIKILGIGNSYTRDSTRWLSKILAEAGYETVIVGQAYIGSITLAEQYASLDASHAQYSSYTYYKFINNGVRNQQAGKTLVEVINDEDWDVVVFQQQSDESGQYASFVSNDFDINDFIAYVKTAISNDSLKVGLVLPWSHATGYVGEKFEEYYNSDPAVQFTAIKTVIPQVANHMSQCDFIVNAGDAIDFGRKNEYLSALGVEMLRTDKNHLQYGIPSYIVGLVYAMTICGLNGTESTWYPTSADEGVECVTSANLARLARICAKNAVLAVN